MKDTATPIIEWGLLHNLQSPFFRANTLPTQVGIHLPEQMDAECGRLIDIGVREDGHPVLWRVDRMDGRFVHLTVWRNK